VDLDTADILIPAQMGIRCVVTLPARNHVDRVPALRQVKCEIRHHLTGRRVVWTEKAVDEKDARPSLPKANVTSGPITESIRCETDRCRTACNHSRRARSPSRQRPGPPPIRSSCSARRSISADPLAVRGTTADQETASAFFKAEGIGPLCHHALQTTGADKNAFALSLNGICITFHSVRPFDRSAPWLPPSKSNPP